MNFDYNVAAFTANLQQVEASSAVLRGILEDLETLACFCESLKIRENLWQLLETSL